MYDRGISFNLNIRIQALEFLDMHKTIFENCFCHDSGAVSNAVQCHELCLHISGKGRVGGSSQVD